MVSAPIAVLGVTDRPKLNAASVVADIRARFGFDEHFRRATNEIIRQDPVGYAKRIARASDDPAEYPGIYYTDGRSPTGAARVQVGTGNTVEVEAVSAPVSVRTSGGLLVASVAAGPRSVWRSWMA